MNVEQLAGIFEAVNVVTLRDNDVLVFRATGNVSQQQEAKLRGALTDITGHTRILILDRSMDVAVLRPEPLSLRRFYNWALRRG